MKILEEIKLMLKEWWGKRFFLGTKKEVKELPNIIQDNEIITYATSGLLNNNKLIRSFIPKETDISEIREEEIKGIEKWMNDYSRKLFNGKSANEMYLSEFTKYFS